MLNCENKFLYAQNQYYTKFKQDWFKHLAEMHIKKKKNLYPKDIIISIPLMVMQYILAELN